MNELERVVASLQSNIEKLIHLHKRYEEENTLLLFEKNQLLTNSELQNKHIKELEQLTNELQSAAGLSTALSASNAENKNRINELVKEIDECIALITK